MLVMLPEEQKNGLQENLKTSLVVIENLLPMLESVSRDGGYDVFVFFREGGWYMRMSNNGYSSLESKK